MIVAPGMGELITDPVPVITTPPMDGDVVPCGTGYDYACPSWTPSAAPPTGWPTTSPVNPPAVPGPRAHHGPWFGLGDVLVLAGVLLFLFGLTMAAALLGRRRGQ